MALLPMTAPAHLDARSDVYTGPDFAGTRRIDAAAIAAVTELYRQILPPGGAILDLMSGWVSHLPPEIYYSRVVGVGPNACELAENPFLDEWRVQDLNRDPRLPFGTAEFDGAAMCVSIQNLTRPCEVIREAGRVLVPSRRRGTSVPDCPALRSGRQLDRYPLPRPDAAGRRRSALCSHRAQPRPGLAKR
jgi:SAM-dependent methyltransferase